VVLRRWAPGSVLDLLALDLADRATATAALGDAAVGTDRSSRALLDAFVAALPPA
jgi:hypothetical protein